LSIVTIAVYHGLYETFGFGSYVPLRLIAIGTSTGVAVAIFWIVRSRVGSAPALVAGTAMLWYPRLLFVPSIFNHYLAVIATVVSAALLRREGRRADIALGLVLAFGLCSSDVAVAGAVGCIAYLALARASPRRWLAVAIPTAAWGIWYWRVALPHKETA